MTKPTITIAMPVYNRAYCLERVLFSILSQDYPKNKIQIIFVDNLSYDGTRAILTKFAEEHSSKFREIRVIEEESNVSEARNICLAHSKGEYILWWDSDVVVANDQILKALEFLKEHSEYVAIGYQPSTEKGNWYEKMARAKGTDFGFSWTLMKSNVFSKIGRFNPFAPLIEDSELFTRIKEACMKFYCESQTPVLHLKPANYKVTYLDHLKYTFRLGKTQFSHMLKISRFQRFKLLYYFLFPYVMFMVFVHWLIPLMYLFPLLVFHIYQAKQNRLYGIVSFFATIPFGLAIAYGYVIQKLKEICNTKNKRS